MSAQTSTNSSQTSSKAVPRLAKAGAMYEFVNGRKISMKAAIQSSLCTESTLWKQTSQSLTMNVNLPGVFDGFEHAFYTFRDYKTAIKVITR